MKVIGNMMIPTLEENDITIIDHSQKNIVVEGKIHLFFNKKIPFLQLKRLYIYREKIMIKPDNKDYSPYLVNLDQIKIVGQVVKVFKNLH